MDMMSCKPELSVVQQIQRDKFRDEQMSDLSSTWWNHRNSNNLGFLQNQISVPVQAQDCTTTIFLNMPQLRHREDPQVQGSSNWRSTDSSSVVNYGYDQGCSTFGQSNLGNLVTVACSGSGNQISKNSYDQDSSSGSHRGEFVFLPSFENQSAAHNANHWNHGNAAVSSTVNVPRHLGPLGPFTGYASILKSSRFLEPAQKMLDEFCIAYALKISRSYSSSMDDDDSDHVVGESSTSSEPLEPKNRLKRAKLLFLHEEVCKRYKTYSHQLQRVVSSFEIVAGLSTSTPYISLALKRISKSFKALRTAISEQLKQISTQQHSLDGGFNAFQKQQRSLIGNQNVESQQQQCIWRTQRGLPERSVVVLRAWLFDHFLHPYPTDSDKQMLASQTGLSRNQVSNWFINARVRLWKPMVEEMHMLETKAIKNADITNNIEPSNRPSPSGRQTLMDLHGTKRSRLEFNRGVGNVSLTLGLRHGMDNVTQTQTQTQDHQFGGGGQMFHDFVG